MKKFVGSTVFAFFILVLAASIAIFLISIADAQSAAGSAWTVVFRFKSKPLNEAPDPDIRIYVLVDGKTEGEAAINAHKALSDKLIAQAADRLEYVESQAKR